MKKYIQPSTFVIEIHASDIIAASSRLGSVGEGETTSVGMGGLIGDDEWFNARESNNWDAWYD